MMESLFIAGVANQMASTNKAQTTGEMAQRAASQVRTQNEAMQIDIEKLFMITEALWMIVQQEHGYTEADLTRLIQDIDLRDGRLDGKVAKAAANPECPQCGRTLIGKRPICLYCGAAVTRDPFER